MENLHLNMLPAFTYGWLNLNRSSLKGLRPGKRITPEAEHPPAVKVTEATLPVCKSGAGPEPEAFLGAPLARAYTAPKNTDCGTLRLSWRLQDAGAVYDPKGAEGNPPADWDAVFLNLEAGSSLAVVVDVTCAAGAKGLGMLLARVRVGENALLRLVLLQRLGEEYSLVFDLGAQNERGGRLELSRVLLGGKHVYDGISVELTGDKSTFIQDVAYSVSGDGHLDMNYESIHRGKKTECSMNVSGVLRDRAFKLLRGTIDLQRGCAGAKGNELEDVLLMDPGVRNQSVPVILCGDEDVEGNHGASIGRLDENLMYYLASRGMDREEIYETMARAKLEAVFRRIPDEKTVKMLLKEDEE